MSEEMRLHLEMQAERNVAEGMSAEEARFAARRAFGGVEQIKEQCREQRNWIWLDHLVRDVRHSSRVIFKAPFLSAVIVVSLGIGIGVNAVVFSWIRGVVLRPIPGVRDATQFLLVEPKTETGSYPGASWQEYRDLTERLPSFQELFAFRMVPLNFGEPGQEERVYSQFVSGNMFTALGMTPTKGRFLRSDEVNASGGAPVAVISHAFWMRHFAGVANVLGQTIRLNEHLITIVGVAPEGFQGTVTGLNFDLWIPATMTPVLMRDSQDLVSREARGFSMMGGLKSGRTVSRAQTELDAAMRELATSHPASNASVRGEILRYWQAPRGAPRFLFGALAALQGFTLLVLIAVCANAANLLLARATARRREIGVRLAIGARPWQVMRLMLTESVVLGMLAAVVGTFLAVWGSTALRAVPLPGGLPFKLQTDLDVGGLAFTLFLGLACSVAFGLVPAVQSARTDSQLALRASSPLSGRNRMRRVLVASQVGFALLVLVIAGLLLRSFLETRTADMGFKQEGVLLAAYDLTGSGYDGATGLSVIDELLGKVRAMPGVEAAAIANWIPLDFHGMPQTEFQLTGRVRTDGGHDRALTFNVTPGYFETMGIPLVEGRDFDPLTDTAHGPQVLVNEAFVRRYIGDGTALGRQLERRNRKYEIIGVVRDSLYETFGEPRKPLMYFSYRERFATYGQFHVRVRGAESALVPNLQRIIREVSPAMSVYDVRTLSEHVDKNLFFRRIPARMFSVLGPLILLLAAVGISAVVSYAVAQRTREIGVRLALGATGRRVVNEMVRESMRGVWLGIVPAWLLAVVVIMHLRGGTLNPVILVAVPALLLAVAWIASWLPARRAAKVDPMVALRCE